MTDLKTFTDVRENFTKEEWDKGRMSIIRHEVLLGG